MQPASKLQQLLYKHKEDILSHTKTKKLYYPTGRIISFPILIDSTRFDAAFFKNNCYGHMLNEICDYFIKHKIAKIDSKDVFIDTINKYIINGTCNGQVLQYMTRLSKSDEWEDADRFASLFYQVIGPLSEDYKEAESTRQASIEKHDAQIKALKAEMAIHEKRIQVLIHEIPKKDKEAAALLAQEQKELEEKVFQIAEKMSAIIGLPEYQSTFRLPPHNLVVAGFLANGDNNCILQQRSFDLLEYETVDLVKNDKDGFETAVEELLQKLFMNEKITQVDLTLSARNGSDEFIHAVLVQPEQMRIYDSHVGLISYESLQELYEDLLERIAIFATDHLEVTGYAVKGAE